MLKNEMQRLTSLSFLPCKEVGPVFNVFEFVSSNFDINNKQQHLSRSLLFLLGFFCDFIFALVSLHVDIRTACEI